MRTHFFLRFLSCSILLTGLVSCRNSDHSKSKSALRSCEEVSCLSSVNWKILLPGRSFPEKSRIDINGTTVLNECVSKQKYAIDRQSEPQMLYLENYVVPKRGELKIEVLNLGGGCDEESVFLSQDADFEVSKTNSVTEIILSL